MTSVPGQQPQLPANVNAEERIVHVLCIHQTVHSVAFKKNEEAGHGGTVSMLPPYR